MCGWPPAGKDIFHALGSAASCGHVCGLVARARMAAGPDGNRGSSPIIAAGSQCPMTLEVALDRRIDRHCHTRVHPRKPSVPGRRRPLRPLPAGRGSLSWRTISGPADARQFVGQRDRTTLRGLVRAVSPATDPVWLVCCSSATLHVHQAAGAVAVPRLLIGPSHTFPPVPSCRGTRQAMPAKVGASARRQRIDDHRCHGAQQDRP